MSETNTERVWNLKQKKLKFNFVKYLLRSDDCSGDIIIIITLIVS